MNQQQEVDDQTFLLSLREEIRQTGRFHDPEYVKRLKAAFEDEKIGQLPQLKESLDRAIGDIQKGCQQLQLLGQEEDLNDTWQSALKQVIESSSYLVNLSRRLIKKKGWLWHILHKPKLNQRLLNVSYIHDYLDSSGLGKSSPGLHSLCQQRLSDYLEKLSTEAEHLAEWIYQEMEDHQQRFHRLPFTSFYSDKEDKCSSSYATLGRKRAPNVNP